MMDGFAAQAQDIQGATDLSPIRLKLVGEAWPGRAAESMVVSGEAIQVMTGAPMPSGADVVVPVEMAERRNGAGGGDDVVDVAAPLPAGKHVGRVGEDIAEGERVLGRGRRLRPQDLGVLSSIGFPELSVIRRPRVRLCLTGNELLPAGSVPRDFQITDANSPLLRPLIQRDGGECYFDGITRDDPQAILEVLQQPADVILISGGSSVGAEDYAPRLIREKGELPIHGISMRPSSPAGLGKLGRALVFLLPGNPVSCLCAYDFFAGRAIRALSGRPKAWPYATTSAPLMKDLSSKLGRLDYARVKLVDGRVEPLAISGASVLSSTTKADGFVLVSENVEGFAAGTEVEVFLYES
jgi:molybdopterin molybdotransferase